MLHPEAAFKGSFHRAQVALPIPVITTARQANEMAQRTLHNRKITGFSCENKYYNRNKRQNHMIAK
jgi:hypothetical protein